MNVIHEKVSHRTFGMGTIIKQTEAVVEVKFGAETGVKKFVFPVVFEQYLELCDVKIKEKMNDELRQIREEIDSKRKMRKEAEQKVIDDTRIELIQKKRAAVKLVTAAKSAAKKAAKKALEESEAVQAAADAENVG